MISSNALMWRSTWTVKENELSNAVEEVDRQEVNRTDVSFSHLPLHLQRPEPSVAATTEASSLSSSTACELEFEWKDHPRVCQQMNLEIVCSARHVEIFIEGVRRNLLGEDEHGEVYLGTFRGIKQQSTKPPPPALPPHTQLFSISEQFLQKDSACNILKAVQKVRVKFVSLTGDKNALAVLAFTCSMVRMQVTTPLPLPTQQRQQHTASESAEAQLSGLSINGNTTGGGFDIETIMRGFQQMLEQEMETKLTQAIDAKLSLLSQRLAKSEQRLFELHQRVDTNNSSVQASLEQIQQQFSQLETHVQQLTIAKTSE